MAVRIERVWTPRVSEAHVSDEGVSPVGAGEANAWVIGDEDEVIVIDPGEDAAAVFEAAGDREILAVICTHGHATHVAAAVEVAERDEAPVAMHRADKLHWRAVYGKDNPDIDMEHGGVFEVGDVNLTVIHTPGHSPGSVSLYCEDLDAVFTGDTLLASGPAPHDAVFPDFPGQLTAIGERLLELPAQTRILPGHGEESTVGHAVKQFDGWVTAGPAVG
jgi:glyoxylase-like metal-dependent hydrolase (beta-lactamase superfamily II)